MEKQQPPKYPCIEMLAKTHGIYRNEKGEQEHIERDDPRQETVYIPLINADQLAHCEQLRRTKKWPMIAAHNLDKPRNSVGGFLNPDVVAMVKNAVEVNNPTVSEDVKGRAKSARA